MSSTLGRVGNLCNCEEIFVDCVDGTGLIVHASLDSGYVSQAVGTNRSVLDFFDHTFGESDSSDARKFAGEVIPRAIPARCFRHAGSDPVSLSKDPDCEVGLTTVRLQRRNARDGIRISCQEQIVCPV